MKLFVTHCSNIKWKAECFCNRKALAASDQIFAVWQQAVI